MTVVYSSVLILILAHGILLQAYTEKKPLASERFERR
jgi:hypothetical protein